MHMYYVELTYTLFTLFQLLFEHQRVDSHIIQQTYSIEPSIQTFPSVCMYIIL